MRAALWCLAITSILGACENAAKPPPDQAALVVVRFQEAPGGTTQRVTSSGQSLSASGLDTGLVLTRYLPETSRVARLPNAEVVLHVTSAFTMVNGFAGQTVRPGTYAITRFTQSTRWAQCFDRETVRFDIMPGEALYLGTLDAKFHAAMLTAAVHKAGRESLRNLETFVQFDAPFPPHLRPSHQPAELIGAQDYAKSEFPIISTPLRQAVFRKTSFEPVNHGLLGSNPACGGMLDVD